MFHLHSLLVQIKDRRLWYQRIQDVIKDVYVYVFEFKMISTGPEATFYL